jgi:hypothetical protein
LDAVRTASDKPAEPQECKEDQEPFELFIHMESIADF